jgi:hypothetical protein
MSSQQAPKPTERVGAPPHERIMNVRKMVAIDLLIHGKRFILIEFGVGTPFMVALGAFILWRASALTDGAFIGALLLGIYLLSLACNYLPLLLYAITFVRRGDAAAAVRYEAAHLAKYAPWYGKQQMLLFIPFLVLALALWQERHARWAHSERGEGQHGA